MYDSIVIGAGSAGSVVAARLSEDPATRVLVLEGEPPDDLPEIAMPAPAPTLWSGPLTWDNVTVPQRHADLLPYFLRAEDELRVARPNLTVETGAQVTRLLLEGDRGTGVRYFRTGQGTRPARPGRSWSPAGRSSRPSCCCCQGSGRPTTCAPTTSPWSSTPPPWGAGLQDHPMVVAGWRTPGTRNLWEDATPENLERWRRERRGPMASFGAEAGGFTRSSGDRPAPDLQFGAIPGPPPLPELGPPTQRAVGILVGAVHVRSRGRVTLASPDPAARPLVDPAYFAAEDDLEVLVAGVRIAREIAAREPLASITDGELMPGADVDDDDRVRDWIRATAGTMFHPTGTCAMGGAAESVCDPELRVRGVVGRRVVDASVMPATPRGNTNAPTIAVAERAADPIRGDTP